MSFGLSKLKNVAVFISGGGSTLQALLDMHHQIDIKLVFCNRLSAQGRFRAKRFGKPVFMITKETDFEVIDQQLRKHNISMIFLAGFMKLLPAAFVDNWKGRIFNIHPSLLPEFKGLNAIENSWKSGRPMGVTIHRVTEEMDAGEIMLQKVSLPDPTPFSLRDSEIFLRAIEQELMRSSSIRLSI